MEQHITTTKTLTGEMDNEMKEVRNEYHSAAATYS